MKHCDKCKIDVRGEFERCPLCQNKLTGESTPYEFPKVQSFYEKYEKIFKFAILVTFDNKHCRKHTSSPKRSLVVVCTFRCNMLLAYDKYMYQETPSHIAEYRRRGCYNINIVRNMG